MVLARNAAAAAAKVCVAGVLALVGCSVGGGDTATATATATGTSASAPTTASAPTSASASASAEATPAVSASPATPPSAAASASPSPVPATGPEQQLAAMHITGGFAGVDQQVVLRGDGTVRTTDRGRSEVHRTTTAQFTRLRTLLGDPALDGVPAYSVNRGAADLFQYTLRFAGRTVVTDRSTDQPPLDRLIDALDDWL
ncbi:hypothetical protein [Streptomyces sp. NPDC002588]|uniref:hypothetical protein n=1 Tax=Streptomyces sp. NPDC002588 TaxID=3154419 RepID=UPI0033298425